MENVLIMPGRADFQVVLDKIYTIEKNSLKISVVAHGKKSTKLSARVFGFSYIESAYDEVDKSITLGEEFVYGKKRSYVKCYADDSQEGVDALVEYIKPDIIYIDKEVKLSILDKYKYIKI